MQRGFSFYLRPMLKLILNQRLFGILALLSLSVNSIGQNDTSIILQQVTVIDQGDPAKFLIKALRQNWRTLERSTPSNLKYYSRKYTSTNNAVNFEQVAHVFFDGSATRQEVQA